VRNRGLEGLFIGYKIFPALTKTPLVFYVIPFVSFLGFRWRCGRARECRYEALGIRVSIMRLPKRRRIMQLSDGFPTQTNPFNYGYK